MVDLEGNNKQKGRTKRRGDFTATRLTVARQETVTMPLLKSGILRKWDTLLYCTTQCRVPTTAPHKEDYQAFSWKKAFKHTFFLWRSLLKSFLSVMETKFITMLLTCPPNLLTKTCCIKTRFQTYTAQVIIHFYSFSFCRLNTLIQKSEIQKFLSSKMKSQVENATWPHMKGHCQKAGTLQIFYNRTFRICV